MRTTRSLIGATLMMGSLVLTGACAGPDAAQEPQIPKIISEGTKAQEFTSLDQLAAKANAIVIGKPIGQEFTRPMPEEHAEPGASPGTLPRVDQDSRRARAAR